MSLLFEPILRRSVSPATRPVLAVLVDESQSMTLHYTLTELPALNEDVRLYGFGSSLRPLDQLPAARDTAPRTDISQALRAAQGSDELIRGILLISDGRYNTGLNPVFAAEESGIPIHTLAIGDSLRQKDVRIVQTLTSDVAYVGQKVPVEVMIFAEGIESASATIQLFSGDTGSGRIPLHPDPCPAARRSSAVYGLDFGAGGRSFF